MRRRHPAVFDRLSSLSDSQLLIDPVDLPFVFLLRFGPHPSLTAIDDPDAIEAVEATASIRASLPKLIDLLEGRVDGDALFFSRELIIEGDTEVVVALRNAVDGADIDLMTDVLSPLGPLARPARRLAPSASVILARASKVIGMVRP